LNKQSTRFGLILLIGVIAIAGTLILKKDKPKTPAGEQAAVMAADESGAITQTDDGTTRGYDRDGNVKWTQPQVLTKNDSGENVPRISNYFCAGSCPNAYGNSAANDKNELLKFGFGDSGPGTQLGAPLDVATVVIRGVPDANTIVVREGNTAKGIDYVFVSPPESPGGSKRLSTPVKLSASATVSPLVSDDHSRIVAVENAPSKSSEETTLRWFVSQEGKWNQIGTPARGEKANACFSGDGRRAVLTGKKTILMGFGGASRKTLPLSRESVSCAFSDDGVTFSYPDPTQGGVLIVVHCNYAGKKVWSSSFRFASPFNSREGNSNLFQIANREGTLLLSAKTGATIASDRGRPASYPAGGNVFVTANSKGEPLWINR
jgi:hypothetical protein